MSIDAIPEDLPENVSHKSPYYLSMEYVMEGDKIHIASNDTVKEVIDLGQIARLNMPPGFVKGESEGGTSGNNYFAEYHLEADPEVKLYFEYRGHRTSKAQAEKFHALLNKPAHKLSPEETQSDFGEILSDKNIPQDFHTQIAKTQDINGKRVLVVEGRYINHDLQARTLYVDTDSTGSAIQEITFQTPVDKRSKYFTSGIKALESIKWK